jgi:ribosomal protein S16
MHDGYGDNVDHDKLAVNYRVALQDFGNKLAGGAIPSLGRWRPQKYDALGITNDVEMWVTTRTLKRRGKRPPTPA